MSEMLSTSGNIMFWFAVLVWAVVVLIFDPLVVCLALTISGLFESENPPP
jgi:hypothetical protein